jgi:hypothetical protein
MAVSVPQVLRKFAVPAVGAGLASYGYGGDSIPGVDSMLTKIDHWLQSNTDYPTLCAVGITMVVLWGIYQVVHWYNIRRKEQWRENLIGILHDGVRIRNRGRRVSTQNEADAWRTDAAAWREKAKEQVAKWDKTLAEDYQLLDVVPPPRLMIMTNITFHAEEYKQLDYRLVKLREVLHASRT